MQNGLMVLWSLGWRVCLLLLAWQLFYELVVKSPARFAESNLVSNQIRVQGVDQEQELSGVLIGSSMIARLNDEKISSDEIKIIQMGLDGGHSRLGLSLLSQLEKKPDFVIIEGNSLAMAPTVNDGFLLSQSCEPIFKIARILPSVRAEQRPSAIIYSRLKEWKDSRHGIAGALSGELLPFGFSSPVTTELDESSHGHLEEILNGIENLELPWDRVIIVMLPNGDHQNLSDYAIASELQKRKGTLILDLKGYASQGEYRFTDGLHLDLSSGNRVSERIQQALQNHFSKKTRVD